MQFLNCLSVQLYENNQLSIHLVKNLKFHPQTKHIDVQYHYIQEVLKDGLISLNYISTTDIPADCLMKSLMREKFQNELSLLSLVDT